MEVEGVGLVAVAPPRLVRADDDDVSIDSTMERISWRAPRGRRMEDGLDPRACEVLQLHAAMVVRMLVNRRIVCCVRVKERFQISTRLASFCIINKRER